MKKPKIDVTELEINNCDIHRLKDIISELEKGKSMGLCCPIRSVNGNEWELADNWYGDKKEDIYDARFYKENDKCIDCGTKIESIDDFYDEYQCPKCGRKYQ